MLIVLHCSLNLRKFWTRFDKNDDLESNESSIWVFSTSGEKLYETPSIKNARSYWVSGGNILILNLSWLDNDELVYESGYSVDGKKETGVARINIKSGEIRMIAQKAINPVSFPPAGQVLVCRYETEPRYPKYFQVITKDGVVSEFVKRAMPYYGMRLMDGLKVVYYERRNGSGDGFYDYVDDIIVYDCTTKQEKVIQGAQIVGSSPDGKELYYMTNQKFLIPIS